LVVILVAVEAEVHHELPMLEGSKIHFSSSGP
jgi:hypothetical protein